MISIGGQLLDDNGAPIIQPTTIDPWSNGMGIFDMYNLSWTGGYDADALPYVTAQVVKQYYDTQPGTPVWNDSALAAVFATNTTSMSPSSATTGTPQPTHHGTDVGAIAGGVVAGVVAICVILALAVFLLRRRRQRKKQATRQALSELSDEPKEYTPMHEVSAESPGRELDSTQKHELATTAPHEQKIMAELDASRP